MTSPGRLAAVWSDAVQRVAEGSSNSLVDRLKQGDATALTFLYREHHKAVRAFARRLLGDPTIAEDLVHDVFLAAPDAFRLYRRDAELRTFLISIAVNKAKHHVRAAMRARRMLEKLAKEPMRPRVESPDEEWERRELCAELQRALDELPIEQRVVIVLCAVEERTAAEVASIVGAPENTVRTRLFHAKRKLRESMGRAT
jgi:RNA polymerase sigma-70 factor (ECF subfamily)